MSIDSGILTVQLGKVWFGFLSIQNRYSKRQQRFWSEGETEFRPSPLSAALNLLNYQISSTTHRFTSGSWSLSLKSIICPPYLPVKMRVSTYLTKFWMNSLFTNQMESNTTFRIEILQLLLRNKFHYNNFAFAYPSKKMKYAVVKKNKKPEVKKAIREMWEDGSHLLLDILLISYLHRCRPLQVKEHIKFK